MEQLFLTSTQFPTLIYSVLLGVIVVYWLVGLLGIIDLDFSGDIDIDTDVDISPNIWLNWRTIYPSYQYYYPSMLVIKCLFTALSSHPTSSRLALLPIWYLH